MTGTAGDADTGKPEARFVYHLINIGSDFDQVVNSVNRDPPTSCESLMELNGHVAIGVPREQVWQALNDPEVLRLCIPGCESVERVSPDEMKARVQIKTGPVRAHFTGKILISEIRPDEGCVLHFEGSGGAAGFAKGRSTVALVTEGAGTGLSYTAAATVGGKLGQVGGRMIDAAARQMADQFFAAFSRHLAPPCNDTDASDEPVPSVVSAAVPGAVSRVIPVQQAGITASGAAESARVLWFACGAGVGSLCTAFGFWVASTLAH